MNSQQPEAPQSSRERDALRRWPFAHSIYQLIQSAPKDWSLRIGVYGRWGEGKTTVLNYVEQMAKNDSFPVAKFNPWAAQDRNELWNGLSIAVEQAFNSKTPTVTKLKRGAAKAAEVGLQFAAATHSAGKAVGGLVAPLLQKKLSVKRSDVEQILRDQLGDRKLIIFIDDLDRTDPKLVPHLLLGLREVLDLPQCAFIMGLDPLVVTGALVEVHSGWGKTEEFLEKIIDFPFWLPPLHDNDIRCLLKQELKDSPINITGHALAEIVHLLPTNPRKLKRFLRGLWRFKGQIERHEEPETEWLFLLLIELLRTVSNTASERLLENKELWDELRTSRFKGELKESDREGTSEEEKWVSIMKSVVTQDQDKEGRLLETERAELLRVMNAMRDLISIEKWQNLHYWARLQDNPPTFTWKEFNRLFEEWKTNPTKAFLEQLIESHAAQIETKRDIVARDLFGMTIAHREQLLAQAAESGPESELIETMKVSDISLSLMKMLIIELRGWSGEHPFLLTSDFTGMFNHFAKWAHFNNPQYEQARTGEASLLKLAAREVLKNATDILDEIKPWSPLKKLILQESQDLLNDLTAELIPGVICNLRDRFIRKDGIDSLWGHDRHRTEKWVLFRKDGGFYSDDGLEFLKDLMRRTMTEGIIHANLLQFIRMLGHGLERGLGPLSPSELCPLASDKGIITLIWRGVVSNRLQPRMIGSLKETRGQLVALIGDEDLLPVPEWWSRATTKTSPC